MERGVGTVKIHDMIHWNLRLRYSLLPTVVIPCSVSLNSIMYRWFDVLVVFYWSIQYQNNHDWNLA